MYFDDNSSYANVLESYMIAEEATIMDSIIPILIASIGYGIYNYKKKKEEKKKASENKAYAEKIEKEKAMKNKELYEKYNLNDSNSRKKFKEDLINDIDKNIKKMVNKANHDKKYFDNIRKEVLKHYSGDEEQCKNILAKLKPGYFTANYVDDYWVIIPDQVVTTYCDLHYDIADVLESNPDPRYFFVSFDNGDGDEGCVYMNLCL